MIITYDDETSLKIISRKLMGKVLKVVANVAQHEVNIELLSGTCVDMYSTITFAIEMIPEVQYIVTHYKDRIDTCYININGKWQVMHPVKFRSLRPK